MQRLGSSQKTSSSMSHRRLEKAPDEQRRQYAGERRPSWARCQRTYLSIGDALEIRTLSNILLNYIGLPSPDTAPHHQIRKHSIHPSISCCLFFMAVFCSRGARQSLNNQNISYLPTPGKLYRKKNGNRIVNRLLDLRKICMVRLFRVPTNQ
ncbi:hypothetical protein BDQ17DRAFT_246904 [Cyathus striatus]|nr:hypothetical protein BDQ17DRAFT_246904 [Cyathus striatus]